MSKDYKNQYFVLSEAMKNIFYFLCPEENERSSHAYLVLKYNLMQFKLQIRS